MKVLFLFSGLPHYYNDVLSKLNEAENLDIFVVVSDKLRGNIGKGVYQTEENINFKVIKLKDYKTFYGKLFFKGIKKVINDVKPNIIVFNWPYILYLIFNPFFTFNLKLRKIKLLYKDIPFNMPSFAEGVFFRIKYKYDENYLNKKQLNLPERLLEAVNTVLRFLFFHIVDGIINYVENPYPIFNSYFVPRRKVHVILNSIDTTKIQSLISMAEKEDNLLPQNNSRLLHLGRLVKWKRVDLLIEALRFVKQKFPEVELLVIGDGPEFNNLKILAEKYGLKNNVIFVGAVYNSVTLAKYILESSIYVLAGMGGLSINEAMAYGKPVICSVCDGTEKHLVFDNYNGYYFKEGDSGDLADKIIMLLRNKDILVKFGNNSSKIISEKVNLNTVIDNYKVIFDNYK